MPANSIAEDNISKSSIAELDQQATKQFVAGNYAASIAYYSEILKRDPKNVGALSGRGKVFTTDGQFELALVDFNQGIALLENGVKETSPLQLAHLYHRRAYAWYGQKRFEDALTDTDKALQLDPNYNNAKVTRALLLAALNRGLESEEQYLQALEQNPNMMVARTNLIDSLFKRKQYGAAVTLCNDWKKMAENSELQVHSGSLNTETLSDKIPVNPENSLFYSNCAAANEKEGNFKEQQEYLNYASSSEVQTSFGYLNRSQAKMRIGENDAALADIEKALETDPRNEEALVTKGYLLNKLGKYESAKETLQTVIGLNDKNSDAYIGLTIANLYLKLEDEAEISANRALELAPDSKYALDNMAYIKKLKEFKNNSYAESSKTFLTLESLNKAINTIRREINHSSANLLSRQKEISATMDALKNNHEKFILNVLIVAAILVLLIGVIIQRNRFMKSRSAPRSEPDSRILAYPIVALIVIIVFLYQEYSNPGWVIGALTGTRLQLMQILESF